MNKANNQLKRDTDRRLQEALLQFLDQGTEPTVGALCEAAQINRSTFYRHYLDVPDLMEKTELHIQEEFAKTLHGAGLHAGTRTIPPEALLPMVEYIGEYRQFYRYYLRTHLEGSMETGMQALWDSWVKPTFLLWGVEDETHMRYYFQSFRASVLSMLKLWLDRNCAESPRELAEMISQLLSR